MSKTTDKAALGKREAVAEVALRVGVSSDYVRKVLLGGRSNDKVKRAYELLLIERAKAQQEFLGGQKGAFPCA